MPRLIIPILLFVDGLLLMLVAAFAHEIGLDPNAAWGRSRFVLLFAGIFLIFLSSALGYLVTRKDHFFVSAIKSEKAGLAFSFGHIWLSVFLIYLWFITFGTWSTWNHTSSYYDSQANAFAHGQLNIIDVEPGKALLAASQPYSPAGRPAFNADAWDMSLYKGRLYLYWGPVPALLITPIKLLSGGKITDNYLVLFFFCGLLIFNSLTLLQVWRRFFMDIPGWNVLMCLPLAGLVLPILWSVNGARVYEAAIAAGQFFLVGGIFFAFLALGHDTPIDKPKLFLAGLLWVGSVGSRATNALSVIFFAGLIVFLISRNPAKGEAWRKSIPEVGALLLPLAAGMILLGWYNWARFDSPFEFGHRYQITILDQNKYSSLMFQPGYFFLNTYNYLIQPFEWVSKFPFIQPTAMGPDLLNRLNIVTPRIYFAGRMTGLLLCAPFLLFGLFHFYPASRIHQQGNPSGDRLSYRFLIYALAGSFIIGFISTAFFFFGQMRYLVDIISQAVLLAIIGYWEIVSIRRRTNSFRSKALLDFAKTLMVVTVCAGLLLAVSSDYDRLKTLNPALFEKIVSSLAVP